MEHFDPKHVSPSVRKTDNGQYDNSQWKINIINAYKTKFAEQANMPAKQKPKYRDLIKSISKETGIGQRTVSTILSEYKKNGTVTSPNRKINRPTIIEKVDDFYKNEIRKIIHEFWLRKEVPTMIKVLMIMHENSNFPTFSNTSFRKILKDLNFEFIKISHDKYNNALIEKRDIVLWRRKYLESIKYYRQQNRPIYYLDETWVNNEDTSDKTCVDRSVISDTFLQRLTTGQKNQSGKGSKLILMHIGSSEGFVDGGGLILHLESNKNSSDCHNAIINGDTFHDWFTSILPLLKFNAVIVMDDAPYHSKKIYSCPTFSWKNQDIINWLEARGEIIDLPLVKQQLLQKVDKLKPLFDSCVIDDVARDDNKIVLRLPPYHDELNPMKLAWSAINNHVQMCRATNKQMDVQRLLNEGLERVTPIMWINFDNRVKEVEDKFWKIDFMSDELLDNEPATEASDVNVIEITISESDNDE
ncbi:uncharacterized protein LOC113555472 [Rhopalosiphum maidis]|uniref:uncharacterized protein LOC113555472 n=1 Tax=Rhopalosiphum maidis TaxID=43146 RepID=UPI000EFFDBCC|nr:uncharacterized protein LOC113555472 [Rhopalosiphum maidis]